MNVDTQNQIICSIQQILQKENFSRQNGEQLLNQYKLQNPDLYIQSMCQIFKSNCDTIVKQFSIVNLGQILGNNSISTDRQESDEANINNQNIWQLLSSITQQQLKSDLFSQLQAESNPAIRRLISDTIGQICGSLQDMYCKRDQYASTQTDSWPELLPELLNLLSQPQASQQSRENALLILCPMFELCPSIFQESNIIQQMQSIFAQSWTAQNENFLKLAGVKAFSNFLQHIELDQLYQNFQAATLEPFMSIFSSFLNEYNSGMDEVLQEISEISETDPSFFIPQLPRLFTMMHQITFDKSQESAIREHATEIMIFFAESLPEQFQFSSRSDRLQQLLTMVFSHMVDISFDVDANWCQPTEGYDDSKDRSDEDEETIENGTRQVDRLLQHVGLTWLLPVLSTVVSEMIHQTDWRYQNAALMALSQIGEYVDNPEPVCQVINLVLQPQFKDNSCAKIRYAVCQCIGQICNDLDQTILKEILQLQTIPALQAKLADPVPRVRSHAAGAFTNLLEKAAKEDVQVFKEPLFAQLSAMLCTQQPSIVMEAVTAALSSFLICFDKDATQYAPRLVPHIFQLIAVHPGAVYKMFRNTALECLSLFAIYADYTVFGGAYMHQLINLILSIQQEGNSNQNNIDQDANFYVIQAWARLADKAKHQPEVQSLLLQNMQSILGLVAINVAAQLKLQRHQKHVNICEENAEKSLNLIGMLVLTLKEKFLPFLDSFAQLALRIISDYWEDSTGEGHNGGSSTLLATTAKCLPYIVRTQARQPNNLTLASQTCKVFISNLWGCAVKISDSSVLKQIIHAMQNCMEALNHPFLTDQEILDFSSKVFQCLRESHQRKIRFQQDMSRQQKFKIQMQNQTHQQDNTHQHQAMAYHGQQNQSSSLDNDELQDSTEAFNQEETLTIKIAGIIGTLIKLHKHQSSILEVANSIFNDILSYTLQKEQTDKMHQFGVYLVSDMLEHLGSSVTEQINAQFVQLLLQYCKDPAVKVRLGAVYALGVAALQGGITSQVNQGASCFFDQFLAQALEALEWGIYIDDDKTLSNSNLNVNSNTHDSQKELMWQCRDNSVACLGKILKCYRNKIPNFSYYIQKWFHSLPITHDKDEALMQHKTLADFMQDPSVMVVILGEQCDRNLDTLLTHYSTILSERRLFDLDVQISIGNSVSNLYSIPLVSQKWQSVTQGLNQNQINLLSNAVSIAQQRQTHH